MQHRALGRSGTRVSEIALGSWLTYGGSVGEETSIACIRRAYDLGVNFFDTADAYGRGAAEEVLGKALQGIPRSSYVLATKAFFPMGSGPNDRGLSRKHVVESMDASLRRLGVDYVDLFQCHRFDRDTPLDETLRALDDLVTAGKALYVGVSEWSAAEIERAAGLGRDLGLRPIITNQPQYSMLVRRIERAVVPVCLRLGIGQIVYSPLAQGVLTGKYLPGNSPPEDSRALSEGGVFMRGLLEDDVLEAVQRLKPLAADAGMTLAQMAIGWVLGRPGISAAIVGATRPEQVEENVAASGRELDDELLGQIDKVLEGIRVDL